MQILNGRRHRVLSLAFSLCGRWLVAGTRGLHLWDTVNATAKPKHLEPAGYRHYCDLAFLPNGRLYFSDNSRKFNLIDPVEFREESINASTGRLVASPDGAFFVRIGQQGLLRWEIDKEQEAQPVAPKAFIGGAAFSPDGTRLATTEFVRNAARLLVLRSANTLREIAAAKAALIADQLVFSPDGTKVVMRSAGSLACYDATNLGAKPRKAVNPSRKHFYAMAVHPEGKLLTVDTEALVKVWDINTLTVVRTVEWNIGNLYTVAVTADGTRAAVGSGNGKVLVWDWD